MLYLLLKGLLTGIIVVGVSETAKRSSVLAAVLASLPLTSIMAMIWLYLDTNDTESVSRLSLGIFWMVIPSLVFFLILPILLKSEFRFYLALSIASALVVMVYLGFGKILKYFGIEL